MLIFIIRRLLGLIPVGLGVIAIVSLLIHTVPGDPVDTILGDFGTLEEKHELREKLGLNEPVSTQILSYIKNVGQGNLGNSLIYNRPVSDMIFERVRATAELACFAMFIAIALSIPLGMLSAIKQGKVIDYAAMGVSLLGVAIPNFWLGPMLILLFSIKLDWLPVSERTNFASYILPAITLGTALAAILSRITRNSMLDNMKEDYARTARAKGNHEFVVVTKHIFRNASLPLVTVIGLQFGALLTGAVVTEKIFDWPGLGSLILEALGNRDYPLVQGCVLFFASSYLFINLITDIAYAAVDPRIKIT